MTAQVDPGPGSTNWTTSAAGFTFAGQSAKWTVTVAGVSTFVYGYERTSPIDCDRWAAGGGGEDACTQFGTDDAVSTSVSVTRVGGFTSAKVYPSSAVVSSSLAGGVLTMQLKKNRHVIIEANGSRQHTLRISSCPLREAVPGGAINWTAYGPRTVTGVSTANNITFGSAHGLSANWKVKLWSTGTLPTAVGGDLDNDTHYFVRVVDATNIELARTSGGAAIDLTGIGSGTITVYRSELTSGVLYFPPGLHRIGRLFDLSSNTTVYLDHGAVVIGSFDVRQTNGVLGMGLGVLSPTTHSSETVAGLPSFFDQITYAPWFGYDGLQFSHDNEVRDITIIGYPYYLTFKGVNRWVRTKVHAPWYWSCDGYKSTYRSSSDLTCSVTGCFGQVADDALDLTDWFSSCTFSDSMLTTTQNSVVVHGYFPNPFYANASLVQNSTFMHYGIEDTEQDYDFPCRGQNVILKSWVDGFANEKGEGSYNFTMRDCEVVGPVNSRVFSIANRLHPFSVAGLGPLRRDGFGEIAGIVIDGLTVEEEPGQPSILEGWDWTNTPRDIEVRGWRVAGELVTGARWLSFVEQNAFPYFVTIEGQPVVTNVELCNRALAYIGESPFVSSISPPDDSKAAKLCAKFYAQAFNEITQGHEWGWATKRIALTEVVDGGNDFYRYCYEEPAGLLRAFEMLPKGAPDGYRDAKGERIKFRREIDPDGIHRLWSNLPDAWLRYSVYVTDPNQLDPWAQEALVLNLAAKLVGAIMQGKEGQTAMAQYLQLAAQHISRAKANDGNQRILTPEAKVSWLEGRE